MKSYPEEGVFLSIGKQMNKPKIKRYRNSSLKLFASVAAILLMWQCQQQRESAAEETVEETVESVEVVRAVILQQVSEMDRALEVCRKRLAYCAGSSTGDADAPVDTPYVQKDWDLDDLSVEELEVFQEMTMTELKGYYDSCQKELRDCTGGSALEEGVPEKLPLD